MEDRVTLNQAEQRRLLALNHLEPGALVNAEAAELLGISIRQVRRLRAAYRERGAAAPAHGNRGRRPAHAINPSVASRVVELATSTYAGVQPGAPHRDACRAGRDRALTAERPSHPRERRGRRCASDVRPATLVAVTGCREKACSGRSTPVGMTGWRAAGPGSAWWAALTTPQGWCRGPASVTTRMPWGIPSCFAMRCGGGAFRWPSTGDQHSHL